MSTTEQHEVIDRYFAAMRRGSVAEADLVALFDVDAVYVEPFTASANPAVGREAIRERLRLGWNNPLPDLELDVLSIEIADDCATSSWECRSAAFPEPVRGIDQVTFGSNGLIERLEVTIVESGEPLP